MKTSDSKGLLACFALILAGAIGNIIDSTFYGLIFSATPYHGGLAELFPESGGYAGIFFGNVVDMLYFPMVDTHWPDWVPYFGGNRFQFFRPVFNIADASISTGVIALLLFYRSFFKSEKEEQTTPTAAAAVAIAGSASTSTEEE